MRDEMKLRVFIKTWLFCNGRCTSRQLADAFNRIGFDRQDITSQQVNAFLRAECNKAHQTTCLHSELKCDFDKEKGVKVWYL